MLISIFELVYLPKIIAQNLIAQNSIPKFGVSLPPFLGGTRVKTEFRSGFSVSVSTKYPE